MPYHTEDKYVHDSYSHTDKSESGLQDRSATGHQPDYQPKKPATISGQIKNYEVDGKQYACDEGGFSSKFGKGGPGDKRGTSGHSDGTGA